MAAAGVTDIYEIGSGKVLAGLAKRIVPTLNATSIGTPQDIEAALPSLSQIEGSACSSLTDKTALVTGATGGIGGAIAKRPAQAGRNGCHLRPSAGQARQARLRARHASARLPCDLGNKAQVAKLIDEATAKLGRLDILVNNAGLTKDNLFMVMKDEQWDEVIAVNLTSTFMLMRGGRHGHDAGQDRLWPHRQHLLGQRHHRQSRGRATMPPPRPA